MEHGYQLNIQGKQDSFYKQKKMHDKASRGVTRATFILASDQLESDEMYLFELISYVIVKISSSYLQSKPTRSPFKWTHLLFFFFFFLLYLCRAHVNKKIYLYVDLVGYPNASYSIYHMLILIVRTFILWILLFAQLKLLPAQLKFLPAQLLFRALQFKCTDMPFHRNIKRHNFLNFYL